MRLIIFDVDGTLVESMATESDAYISALHQIFGFEQVNSDWSKYMHVTDPGILRELFVSRKRRLPTDLEVAAFRQCFIGHIDKAAHTTPLKAVAGAKRTLEDLRNHAEMAVAIGTGAWFQSAAIKLACCKIDLAEFPSATGDDSEARIEIIELAMSRARQWHENRQFSSVLYVGDGLWDARACRQIGIPFVGVSSGLGALTLLSEGAVEVLPDLHEAGPILVDLCRHAA